MQVKILTMFYADAMKANGHGQRLKKFRVAAGLSQRELARQIGERQSNIQYWESTDKLPKSEALAPMAKALGITLEELMGEPKPRKTGVPRGQLAQVFEDVSQLPRRQQKKVIEFVEAFVTQQKNK